MPQHARGAHYFGEKGVAAMFKCDTDHRKIGDQLYSQIKREGEVGFKSGSCAGCGARINVAARTYGDWEVMEFPSKVGKEAK